MTLQTYKIAESVPDLNSIAQYLTDTGQTEFQNLWNACDLPAPLRLVSMAAKICYKSLVPGKNANVSKTRDIEANINKGYDRRSWVVPDDLRPMRPAHAHPNLDKTDGHRRLLHL